MNINEVRWITKPLEFFYFCMDYNNPYNPLRMIDEKQIKPYSAFELQYNFTHLSILRKLFSHSPPNPYKFLDLGCGIGNVLWIAIEHNAKKACGIEISRKRAELGEKILDNPEKFLGGKDEDGVFKYLKLYEDLFQPIEKYNKLLEEACTILKRNKHFIEIKRGDIFSLEFSFKIEESDMIYINIPALFLASSVSEEKRKERQYFISNLLEKNKNAIIGIVGIELEGKKIIDEIKWEPDSFDLKLRIYK